MTVYITKTNKLTSITPTEVVKSLNLSSGSIIAKHVLTLSVLATRVYIIVAEMYPYRVPAVVKRAVVARKASATGVVSRYRLVPDAFSMSMAEIWNLAVVVWKKVIVG